MSDGVRASSRDDVGRDPLVLVVDDEQPMRRFLRVSLAARGYRSVETATARDGLLAVIAHQPDLVLLDLGLPDGDGVELTRQIREVTPVPIIVVSARGREMDKIGALDAGADDYLGKPFDVHDLLTKMQAALRQRVRALHESPPAIVLGELQIDLVRGQVTVAGAEVQLMPSEYRLLVLLARNVGRVLTRTQILDELWGGEAVRQPHHLSVLMAELRRKIEREPARPRFLVSEPGVGYRLLDRASLSGRHRDV